LATFFPRDLPNGLNECERKIFNLLNRLGEDCFIYYEPHVRNRRPDFVVVIPDVGVLVVEAKGWPIDQIVRATRDRITFDTPEGRKTIKHPQEQAREYAFGFIKALRDHPAAKHILRTSGPHLGNFAFPVSWIAAYCNITRDALEEHDLDPCFPANRNVTRDELKAWRQLDERAFRSALKTYFDPWWPHSMSWFETTLIRNKFYPIIIPKQSGDYTSTDIKILDADQEQIAFNIGEGHRVVRGVAGSGKTIILIARAKYLAAAGNRRVLILCYNRLLSQFIASCTKEYSNIEVRTFARWSASNGVMFNRGQSNDDTQGAALRDRFESSIAPDAGQFDCVLVDEAQLMSRDWLICARLALRERDPAKASLFIVADGSQSLKKVLRFTWKEAGIAVAGRSRVLKINYRNTTQILVVAIAMATSPGEAETSESPHDPTGMQPEACVRQGKQPELIVLDNRQSECDYAAALVRTWLLGGVQVNGKTVKPVAEDIAIIYPHNPPNAPNLVAELTSKLAPLPSVVLSGERPGKLADPGIRILSMKAAPGLQFRFVILLWTDLLPAHFTDDDDEALLYVAMTRAEDMLVVLHSKPSEFIDRIAKAQAAAMSPDKPSEAFAPHAGNPPETSR
jgi:Nuclease-related domain/AAA domain/UvrD-like helicase C-terminal domain